MNTIHQGYQGCHNANQYGLKHGNSRIPATTMEVYMS
jgi:hypothetical protein